VPKRFSLNVANVAAKPVPSSSKLLGSGVTVVAKVTVPRSSEASPSVPPRMVNVPEQLPDVVPGATVIVNASKVSLSPGLRKNGALAKKPVSSRVSVRAS
jgi:hypothetical protein